MTKEEIELLADMLADRVTAKLAERAERKFLSREEYAKVHGLGVRTIDRAIAEGCLKFERSGRRVLIPSNAKIEAAG